MRRRAVRQLTGWIGTIACAALLVAAVSVASPASAQGLSARGFPSALSPAGRDWMAVGRLEVAAVGEIPRSFCTVSLIAEDRALTAAHCVIDRATGRSLPPAAMELRLGLQNGRAEATRRVTGVLLPAGIEAAVRAAHDDGGAGLGLGLVPVDLAILSLDSPVRLPQVMPLSPVGHFLDEGRLLSVVSYARGRSEAAGLQEDCQLLARRPDGALVLVCEVDSGASGSPVLATGSDGPQVVAVVSAKAEMLAQDGSRMRVALAAPLAGRGAQDLLRIASARREADGIELGPDGVRIRRPGIAASGGGGARFVRP